MMKVRFLPIPLAAVLIAACSTVNRDNAKALGMAGQMAAQALGDQATAARDAIDVLPQWWAVRDALVCANVSMGHDGCLKDIEKNRATSAAAALTDAQRQLSEVMTRRAQAIAELRDAYGAFVNLANYDAGEETGTAIKKLFSGVNDASKAASALLPQAAALPEITATFTTVAAGVAAFGADQRQGEAMLKASRDLHTACDALGKVLLAERDKAAAESLLVVIQTERMALYQSGVDAGLLPPIDSLSPIFASVAPGVRLAVPPEQNADVVRAAAKYAAAAQAARQQAEIVRTYDAAIATLGAVSREHAKLEGKASLDASDVIAEAKHLQSIIASLNALPKT
jgi:hypothetical protein